MIKFRYDCKLRDDLGIGAIGWAVYKFTGTDPKGVYVGYITDKETVELLTQAPTMRRLMDDQKRFGVNPRMALRPRTYTHRKLRDYALAMYEFFKKL